MLIQCITFKSNSPHVWLGPDRHNQLQYRGESGRSLYWCQDLHIMNEDMYQNNERSHCWTRLYYILWIQQVSNLIQTSEYFQQSDFELSSFYRPIKLLMSFAVLWQLFCG